MERYLAWRWKSEEKNDDLEHLETTEIRSALSDFSGVLWESAEDSVKVLHFMCL